MTEQKDSGPAHTPGPWWVRKNERNGELRDCFVAAKDINGFPYDAEILGDDEYHTGGIVRKLADCHLIAAAPDMAEAMAEFCSRVDAGEVRSTKTYAQFKAILAKARGRA
jgi:hypothetical protein